MEDQSKQLAAEGSSISRPPAFQGEDYPCWKDRMEMFIKSTQYSLWKIITKGDFIPTDSDGRLIEEDDWTTTQMEKVQDNFKAKYLLTCALSRSEYDKVFECKTAKDVWDNLSFIHENSCSDTEDKEADEAAHAALMANINSDSSEDESEKNAETAHPAFMANSDSEASEDESEVYAEPSDLENDYENLLRDS